MSEKNKAQGQEMADIGRYGGRSQTITENRAAVSVIVDDMFRQLERASDGSRRIDLNDIDLVDAEARRYTAECATESVLPTVTGLASWLGRSRDSLYKHSRDHGQFRDWLNMFSDLCGTATARAAMEGTVAAIPAIFTLKARHGWSEGAIEINVGRSDPLDRTVDERAAAEIAAKYADLPDD